MNTELLLQEPTIDFRAIKRKGTLRYIASNQHGSLSATTRFAPPTKRIPLLILKLAGCIDFKIPTKLNWVTPLSVSEVFLSQVAKLLNIPIGDIGIYVGEPTAQQKLVVTDVKGKSAFVVKIANGAQADATIKRETTGITKALASNTWPLGIPSMRNIESICGRKAILIERVLGSQLTQQEFEHLFFNENILPDINSNKSITIEQWLESIAIPQIKDLTPTIDKCRRLGALDIQSSLGIVHGDFAPWNVIKRSQKNKTAEKALTAIDWEFSSQNKPIIFDIAYAAWCYETLLEKQASKVNKTIWNQLVSLGALWEKVRSEF